MSESGIRGRWSRGVLEHVRRLPESDAQRILERIPAETLHHVEGAGRLTWVPIEAHLAMLEATRQVLGPSRFVEFYRDATVDNVRSSPLQSVISGGLRMFGLGRSLLVKMLPRGWSLITQDCGTLRVEKLVNVAGGSIVHFEGLPEPVRTSDTYALTLRALAEGLIAQVGEEAVIQADITDLPRGVIRLHMRALHPEHLVD